MKHKLLPQVFACQGGRECAQSDIRISGFMSLEEIEKMEKVEDRYRSLPCGCIYYQDRGNIIRFYYACDDCRERLLSSGRPRLRKFGRARRSWKFKPAGRN